MSKRQKEITYELAYAELSEILQILQNHEITLEEMTARLRRAKELIAFCEEQLQLTEVELSSIFDEEEE